LGSGCFTEVQAPAIALKEGEFGRHGCFPLTVPPTGPQVAQRRLQSFSNRRLFRITGTVPLGRRFAVRAPVADKGGWVPRTRICPQAAVPPAPLGHAVVLTVSLVIDGIPWIGAAPAVVSDP
jgi:hypothetical protein